MAKLTAEHYLYAFRKVHELRYVALRYGNVYGPRQDPHGEAGVVAIFSERLRAGERATIYGDGEQVRDYVHVADVVRANMLVSERLETLNDRPIQSVDDLAFNISTGTGTSVKQLYTLICRRLGVDRSAVYAPPGPGELQRSVLDGCKAERFLGFRPQYDLKTGLAALA